MATPNSPFGPPAGGSGPVANGGANPRRLRPLPPPLPPTDLDAKLGALLAEGSTGATEAPEPRQRRAAVLILGGVLVIGAGLGLGWGIGRATRSSSPGTNVSVTAFDAGRTVPAGAVSDAPPSADDATEPAEAGDDRSVPAVTPPGIEGSDLTTVPTTGAGTTTASSSPAASIAPSATSAAVPASSAPVPTSLVPPDGPIPTIVSAPEEGANLVPTAFAVLEEGRLTLRGAFADQQALDQAITDLAPLGVDSFAVEAIVDPTVVGSRQVPVLVSDAAIFQRGSAILGDGAQPALDLFASAMRSTSTSRLIIEGHTDSQGSDAYNFALSQQRIAAVFAYLTSKGVDPARLELVPRGETEPVADNGTDEGRRRNRRVELVFAV